MASPKTIELKNVGYRYEGAESEALRKISLTINPAEHIAVVGLNGAGKTTLVKLICGLIDPTEGTVLYDGIDVKEYDRRGFYKLFSAVFQQFSLMPVTIGEIVAETAGKYVDDEKVERCLRQAGLWEKIASLPKGMKSEFGKAIYGDGVELSGGETQKLLLARALYKAAPVMILDEPTAALDPISESRLYETYNEIMRGQSTVFISHRLASTRFCSRILLIEDGAVIEEGTHESLLLQKGRYYELFATQAKYYREHPEGEEADTMSKKLTLKEKVGITSRGFSILSRYCPGTCARQGAVGARLGASAVRVDLVFRADHQRDLRRAQDKSADAVCLRRDSLELRRVDSAECD